MARDFARELARLDQRVKNIEKGQRYAHGGSIENNALEVKDGAGSLRAIVGVQSDGTTAVNIVNGPPPPTPTAPILASVLGGITVSWNGGFADGTVPPLDWQRVEVHASTTDGFTPALETLKNTFETPQGGTVVVPCEEPVYVLLVARNTSGTASEPTVQAGPLGPAPVVATDLLDGIVTELKLADNAVTEAKIAADAVGSVALQESAVLAENLADAAVEVGKIADNAVTGPAIASEAVTAGKLAADSVVAGNIQAGAVTSAKVAAGAITTDKLTVTGGANLLTDPSFEGAYTASIIAGLSYASQDTTRGNGSPTSLKIDATSGSPTNRSVVVTAIPVLPGDQLNIGVDYWVETAWAGSSVNVHIRWETAAGGVVSYGIASSGASPTRNAWTRLSGTYTAPATAAVARLRIESSGGTAGAVWFDNASVRPVLGGTQIQDGAVTTQKLVAGAVQTAQLDSGAVNTDKLAAGAVTTAKLDALAVTADKIAANAITAGKILAGAVDATALAADAITGKTITGGTINGAIIQTAETGERITLNEADANKILVYNTTEAIGELSARGLLVKGTGGAVMWLDPSAVLPQLRFDNASGTNSAFFQMAEVNPGDANIQFYTGAFTADGYTDRVWRQYMGADFTMIERIRRSSSSTWRGGRINLRPEFAEVGYMDSADAANAGYTQYQAGAVSSKGRHLVEPQAASSDSALHVTAQSGHTGNLMRLFRDGEKFAVDKDGNTNITGMLTAGNIVTGTTTITPSAAHTPTSTLVSFPALKGTTFRGYATAATTVPGVRTPVGAQGVTGVSMSSVTSSNALVWVNRENTTATIVNWMVIAS
ncbi:hypothetical protein [Streptomyces sp. NPDC059712]|uniref:hypothetical protein n=1 Tax=Streptomyces sp. NPDC059712 TaxID=3346919 RepID=UPI003694F3A7